MVLIFLAAAVRPPPVIQSARSPTAGDLIVNEILYAPADGQVEFVEIFNRSNRALDLATLRIADERRRPAPVMAAGVSLPPGAFLVIVRDGGPFRRQFPHVRAATADPWPPLNNSGDVVMVFAGRTLIDSVRYRGGRTGETAASLERVDPSGRSSDPRNWQASTDPAGSTPGRRNSIYAPDVTAPQIVLAEQVSSRMVLVHVDEPVTRSGVVADNFSCGPGAPAKAANLRADQRAIEVHLSRAPSADACAVRGLQDGSGNRIARTLVPLAYRPGPGDLVINEIMYQPVTDPFDNRPDQPEYVELYNRSGNTLSVTGLYWTDRTDEDGAADTTTLEHSFGSTPPGGFVVIFADGDDGAAALRRAFPEMGTALTLIPVAAQSLGLRSSGETIRLHGSDATIIDRVAYSPDWHHLDLIDPHGVALERIAAAGPSGDGSNWSSSTAISGGSPGRPNAVAVQPPGEPPGQMLRIVPSPFSPDGDGRDDHTAIEYHLSRPLASLRVRLFDSNGYLVRTLTRVRLSNSAGTLVWDGRDDHARPLPAGIYIVLLEAVDAAGGSVERHKAPVVLAR